MLIKRAVRKLIPENEIDIWFNHRLRQELPKKWMTLEEYARIIDEDLFHIKAVSEGKAQPSSKILKEWGLKVRQRPVRVMLEDFEMVNEYIDTQLIYDRELTNYEYQNYFY